MTPPNEVETGIAIRALCVVIGLALLSLAYMLWQSHLAHGI